MSRTRERPVATVEALIVLAMLALVVVVGVGAWAIGHYATGGGDDSASAGATPASSEAVPGEDVVVASDVGDVEAGALLWNEKSCSACHSLEGVGGTDAPPLDFMRGNLKTRDFADMSGRIWNHLPVMLAFFEEEGIPVPTFERGEMADLAAFLHGGGAPPPPPEGEGEHG